MTTVKSLSKLATDFQIALEKFGAEPSPEVLLKAWTLAFPKAKPVPKAALQQAALVARAAGPGKGDAFALTLLAVLTSPDGKPDLQANSLGDIWDWIMGGSWPPKSPSCRSAELNWQSSQIGIQAAGRELETCLQAHSGGVDTGVLPIPDDTGPELPPPPTDPCAPQRKKLKDALDRGDSAYFQWAAACE